MDKYNNNSKTVIFQYVVPSKQRLEILQSAHDIAASGHLGIEKTTNRIKERFYWPNWESDVKIYVLSCQICQKIKAVNFNTQAPLQPIFSSKPFEKITYDCMGPVPKSKSGNEHALIICDHFTKYLEVLPLRHIKAPLIAKTLMKYICRHGIPDQILTDQGTNFQSEMLSQLYDLLDIHKTRTAAYHPQTDGLSERSVRTIKTMITAFISEDQKNWDENLHLLCFAYNTAIHATTQFSPFYLLYGRVPKIPLDLFTDEIVIDLALNPEEYAQQTQMKLQEAYKIVRTNRDCRMQKAKIRHDRSVRAAKFIPNDLVWVQIKHIRKGKNKSLSYKWEGPYVILETFNDSTYKVKLQNRRSRAQTIHRDILKKCFMRPDKFTNPKTETVKIESSIRNDQTNGPLNQCIIANHNGNNALDNTNTTDSIASPSSIIDTMRRASNDDRDNEPVNALRRSSRQKKPPDRLEYLPLQQ